MSLLWTGVLLAAIFAASVMVVGKIVVTRARTRGPAVEVAPDEWHRVRPAFDTVTRRDKQRASTAGAGAGLFVMLAVVAESPLHRGVFAALAALCAAAAVHRAGLWPIVLREATACRREIRVWNLMSEAVYDRETTEARLIRPEHDRPTLVLRDKGGRTKSIRVTGRSAQILRELEWLPGSGPPPLPE